VRAMRRRKRTIAQAVVFLVASVVGNAATVRGQLVDASKGHPSIYVAVRLNSASIGPSEFAYSGNNGKFYIKNVPEGDYQLEVWRGGNKAASIRISVQEPTTDLGRVRVP
jgi:hypothetical protein